MAEPADSSSAAPIVKTFNISAPSRSGRIKLIAR
jgi:hypothetical protein